MEPADLPVFILCGGKGTRLREETEFRPKPMVSIGDRPILWHIMKGFSHFGCHRFMLCLGYKAEMIREYFLNYRTYSGSSRVNLKSGEVSRLGPTDEVEDWEVNLLDTGLESLTGLRVQKALELCPADRFFLTYGDGVANVDVAALLEHHERLGRLATVTAVHPSSRFGELDIEGDRARSFSEKPQTNEGWINGGFMVVEREAFDLLGPGENEPLETSVMEKLSEQGQLSVYMHDGFWQCMDTYRESELLNGMWASGSAKWKVWG